MEAIGLGKEVARIRRAKRVTQEQLGRMVGLPKRSISKMENGKMRLSWEDASILMEAMGETLTLPVGQNVETLQEQELRLQMLTSAIEWFAAANDLSLAQAYKTLSLHKVIDFLSTNYRYEQTLPKAVILNDMLAVCKQNGAKV